MKQQFEITPDLLGTRDTIRQNTKRGEEIVRIPLAKIIIRKGFNIREEYGDLESLAASIKENGQQMPGRVDVLKDGTFVLTDGHRRFKAMKLLKEDILFKAIVNDRETTEEDRLIQMFTTQDNKQLQPHEAAALIQRLITFGRNQAEIAHKIGRSAGYVSQMISFAREDEEVKDLVKAGKTSVATVLKTKQLIKNKDERTKKISEAAVSDKKMNVENITGTSERDQKISKLASGLMDEFQIDDKERLTHFLYANY